MAPRLFHQLWESFLQLNLYKTPSSDIHTASKERLATRLYICSLTIAILIITIVAASLLRTVNKTEYQPSHERYSYLSSKYSTTLSCPCSTIGIAYNTFVNTDAHFHQVCSSSYVQQTWIDQIFVQQDLASLVPDDFRYSLSFFWQVISGLCSISNTTWYDVVANFNATFTFNPLAISEQTTQAMAKTTLNNAINVARTRLNRNLLAIRRMLSGNQIVSALGSNYHLQYPSDSSIPRLSARVYGNCSCRNNQGCPHSASIINTHGDLLPIPGIIADCFVMDGTLASTLECYYNQSCLSLVHSEFSSVIQPLSNALNKHFMINSTVEMLLNELMIDEIISNVQFDLFYAQCNPAYCSYSYNQRFDALFIITTIIGIFGSISLAFKIIAPFIVTIVLKRKNKSTRHLDNPQQKKCE